MANNQVQGARVMDIALWVVCVIFGVPSALLILLNWCGFVEWIVESVRRETRRNFSFFPFLAGVAGAIALLVCPLADARFWAWVPLALDPSILLQAVVLALHLIARLCGFPSMFDAPQSPDDANHAG